MQQVGYTQVCIQTDYECYGLAEEENMQHVVLMGFLGATRGRFAWNYIHSATFV